MSFRFRVLAKDGAARRGLIETPHGAVETPAFLPVGTLGAVKGVAPAQLADLGASILLANLYHLAVRPGVETIARLGGLHAFCGWQRPILTDSGGFQVWSLARLCQVDEGGVTFRNHVDGAEMRLTPESVVAMQERLGVDIAMVLDECPPYPCERAAAERSLERTLAWARRSRAAWAGGPTALFGIVQGSVYEDLRLAATAELAALGFAGLAIGGVAVGEPESERYRIVERVAPALPEDRPRYLMGVGTPADILHAVAHGVDLFDCVLPSRNGRHGVLFEEEGPLTITNARFRDDPTPLRCGVSRAFLHHLFTSGEVTAQVLATLHNLSFYLDFMRDLREAITLAALADRVRATVPVGPDPSPIHP
ncbi:MAG: tRNA guanosine(34) transglycosylase Tgt [Thermoanaerobaculia bacterium]